jgi:hypothetical protein
VARLKRGEPRPRLNAEADSDHQPRTLEDVSLSGPVRTIVVEPLEVPEPAPKPVKV